MSFGYQKVIMVGTVGRDSEMKYTSTGVAVCDFSIAINKKQGKGAEATETTTWVKVTAWRERAETASQFVKKGMKILVEGEVKATAYMDKSGNPQASLELTASEFKFLDSKPQGQSSQQDPDDPNNF